MGSDGAGAAFPEIFSQMSQEPAGDRSRCLHLCGAGEGGSPTAVVCRSASEDIKFPNFGTSGLSAVFQVRKGSRTIHRLPCFLLLGNKRALVCIA